MDYGWEDWSPVTRAILELKVRLSLVGLLPDHSCVGPEQGHSHFMIHTTSRKLRVYCLRHEHLTPPGSLQHMAESSPNRPVASPQRNGIVFHFVTGTTVVKSAAWAQACLL